MGTIKTTNIESISGSGTVTLGTSGETITVPTGVTVAGGLSNTPVFSVSLSGDQTLSDSTATKITLDTEQFDTDNAFASNKFTVPSGADGKYLFVAQIQYINLTNEDQSRAMIYKNNNVASMARNFQGANGTSALTTAVVLNLVAGDYIELFGFQVSGGDIDVDGGLTYVTFMQGFKLV